MKVKDLNGIILDGFERSASGGISVTIDQNKIRRYNREKELAAKNEMLEKELNNLKQMLNQLMEKLNGC